MNTEKLTSRALELGALQKPRELSKLFDLLRERKLKTVVEIGTAKGGVFYGLCQLATNDATIVSIDLPDGKFGGGYTKEEEKKFKTYGKKNQKLVFIREDSHDHTTFDKLFNKLLISKNPVKVNEIDLLFIDGDHTYGGVKKDFEMYATLVKNGGLIVFHDICYHPYVPECQVDKFWKEIKPKFEILEFIDRTNETWGGIGVVKWGVEKTTTDVKETGLLLDISKGVVQKGFTRLEHDLEVFPWPIEDNSVHICVGAHVIEHIQPWLIMKFFDELWRIVKPSGQVALSTPYAGSMSWWSDPTHCTGFTERSFAYLDPDQEAYKIHRPKPWKLEKGHPTWKTNGNLETILFPIK